MKDSIRQGGVLSVIQFALMMDEICKNIHDKNLGVQINENKKVGCLAWMDDLIMLTTEKKEMQQMLNITNDTSGPNHLEYGSSKSQAQAGDKMEKVKFNLGEMELEYTDKYKYLGYMQNTKNNQDDQIIEIKKKTDAAYQTIIAIAGSTNFKGIKVY